MLDVHKYIIKKRGKNTNKKLGDINLTFIHKMEVYPNG